MTKAKIKGIIIAAVILIAAIIVLSTAYTVKENQFGIVKQFGKVVTIRDNAGFYLKIPFIEEVSYLPKTLLFYDVTPSDVLTSDKKALVVDSYTVWKIIDPLRFVQSVSTTEEMESRLDAATFSVTKNTMGTMLQTSIIQSGASETQRNEVNALITKAVNEQVKAEYGVEVVNIEIKKLDLPESNEAAVYGRMISEREQIAAKYIAEGELEASVIRNDTDKEAAIIISEAQAQAEKLQGEGEAEYMRILADAYHTQDEKDFYAFYRSLEAAKKAIVTDNSGKQVLILSGESELAKILMGE